MHRSRSRSALAWAIPVVFSTLSWAVPAAAQTTPDADAYAGLRCFATIMSLDETAALVTGSRDPGQQILSRGDLLYLDVRAGFALAVDGTYPVYRVEGEIDHPDTGGDVGDAVVIVGTVRVVEVSGSRALAVVEDDCGEIEVGDHVHPGISGDIAPLPMMPEFSPARLITPVAADGTVVYGHSESLADQDEFGERRSTTLRRMYAVGDVVTVDRGTVHGWAPGTVVLFYDPEPALSREDTARQDEPVVTGQGYVIWADADTAALLITDGDRAVELGAKARILEDT